MVSGIGRTQSNTSESQWWRRAVIYRIDTRSFRDSDGDGVGDLNGIRDRLGYLELIGADLIWLTAFLASPVGADPESGCHVDPVLGDLNTFGMLVEEAHQSGIRISIDISIDRAIVRQPWIGSKIDHTIRFWADHGVDGFRAGITPGLMQAAGADLAGIVPMIRRTLADYPGCILSAYVDERLHDWRGLQDLIVAADSRFCQIPFDAKNIRNFLENILTTFESVDISPIMFIAGWELARPVARFGGGRNGLTRARALALVQLAIPGLTGIDNGDELGLAEYLQAEEYGGQYTRGLMPWENSNPTFGFTDAAHLAPPSPAKWANRTVKAQMDDPESMLWFYRRALHIRREYGSGHGTPLHWYQAPEGCLAFRCGEHGLICALNTTPEPVALPDGELLLSSEHAPEGVLTGNSAAWLI